MSKEYQAVTNLSFHYGPYKTAREARNAGINGSRRPRRTEGEYIKVVQVREVGEWRDVTSREADDE